MLKGWRQKKKLSQRAVARCLSIWPNSVLELEQGRRVPTLPIAVELERLAGIECKFWLQV